MSKRSVLTLVVVLAIIAALVGVYLQRGTPDEKQPVVRIGYLNIVASLPLFVAAEKGFLKEEGVKYEALPVESSNQLVDSLISGHLDCYIESSAVPVLAVQLQSPGKLKVFSVSEITPKAPFDSLLVRADSSIKKLSDLAGKKIGVFPGSTATNLLKKHLSDKGVDVSGITFVPILPPSQLAALLKGSVDAIHAYEPTTAIALSKGGIRQLSGSVYAEMLSPNPQGVAALSSAFVEQHPELAARVVAALERAMIFMKEHDAETRQILVKRMKLPEAAAQRCVFLYMLPHDKIDNAVLQRYSDMLSDLGELKGKVDVADLVYRP